MKKIENKLKRTREVPMNKTAANPRASRHPESSTNKFKDPLWFRERFKIIAREWAQYLTLRQLGMVFFIFDRTAAWGKEWEMIRYESFVNGVTSKDKSKRYAAGVCSSISVAQRLTKELHDMGILKKRRHPYGIYWALNYHWSPKDLTDMKKTTKLRRDRSDTTYPDSPDMTDPDRSEMTAFNIPKGIKGNDSQKEENTPPAEGVFDFEEKIKRVTDRAKASREKRKKKNGNRLTQAELLTIWLNTSRESDWAIYTAPREHLKKTELHALLSYSKRFAKTLPDSNFREYLPWVLGRWAGLMSELFGWMTNFPPPEVPNALFFIKYHDKFEEAYLQGLAFDERMKLTPEERKVADLVKSGMSRADALKKLFPNRKPDPKPAAKKNTLTRHKSRKFSRRRKQRDDIALPPMNEDYCDYEED